MQDHRPGELLALRNVSIAFPNGTDESLAIHDVSIEVMPAETLGIVGESGCGKSMTLRTILGLVPEPGKLVDGEIYWRGTTRLTGSDAELRRLRGREISMIFQDPLESLNPVFSIGDQLVEVLRKRGGFGRAHARVRAVDLLEHVGIPSAEARMRDYPHQLSGGMRQRVMIAIAIACGPALLLADEPTTALDVTIQDQILNLLAELQRERELTMILVSHDLGVIAQMADRIAVMYAGRVVEIGPADEVLSSPRHPYTAALIAAEPGAIGGLSRLPEAIPGTPPALTELPIGCSFAPRCAFAQPQCEGIAMDLDRDEHDHRSACPIVEAHQARRHRHG